MANSKRNKLLFFCGVVFLIIATVGYSILQNSASKPKRTRYIELGNILIQKIYTYKEKYGLPATNDLQNLQIIGFSKNGESLIPQYQKLNDSIFELIFKEEEGEPDLRWNSFDKLWKNGATKHLSESHIDEDVISLVEQSPLYLEKSKLIDSLSSAKRVLFMTVNIQDTTKNIYLVKVAEGKGINLKTYYNFLIDANKMKILNPTGKLDGQ